MDKINPQHYSPGNIYETIKVLRATLTRDEFVGFLRGQVIKYYSRAGKKEGESYLDDIKKGSWYDNYLVDFLQEEQDKGSPVKVDMMPTSSAFLEDLDRPIKKARKKKRK